MELNCQHHSDVQKCKKGTLKFVMCENLHEMHPAGATEASGTETNASGSMAGCVIKSGNHIVKWLGFAGITKCCKYNASGIILTGGSRNNTAGINKTSNCSVCSGTGIAANVGTC
jgi:hypothetical protein